MPFGVPPLTMLEATLLRVRVEVYLSVNQRNKTMINFEILEHDGVILIESNDDSFTPYSIDIDRFWGWVQKQGLNEYCNDYFDPTHPDNHRQETGTFTREEYLDLHYSIIKIDLLKYIDRYKRNPNK